MAIHGLHPNSDWLPSCVSACLPVQQSPCGVGVVDSIDRADCMQCMLCPLWRLSSCSTGSPCYLTLPTVSTSAASRVRCVTQWWPNLRYHLKGALFLESHTSMMSNYKAVCAASTKSIKPTGANNNKQQQQEEQGRAGEGGGGGRAAAARTARSSQRGYYHHHAHARASTSARASAPARYRPKHLASKPGTLFTGAATAAAGAVRWVDELG